MNASLEQNTLLLPPRLARKIGMSAALVLQQLHYWLKKTSHTIKGVRWIYNSFLSWAEQLPLAVRTIKRAIAKLKDLNLIQVERHGKQQWDQTNWYTINYQELEALISPIVPGGPHQAGQPDPPDEDPLAPSSSEITPETFPEKRERPVNKKQERLEQEEWFSLAHSAQVVAIQHDCNTVITGLQYELGGGCYRDWKKLAKEYPLSRLDQMCREF
jgi:hypothetical protein